MFRLGKSEFKVKEAQLSASYHTYDDAEDTEFLWHINIEMEEGKFIFEEDERISPRLYQDNGFRIETRSWKELEGIKLVWEEEENDNFEEAGYVHTFYDDAITEATIEFMKRNGNKYLVRWSGFVEEDLPFKFEGELEFKGIVANTSYVTEEEVKTEMMKFIDMDDFECVLERCYERDGGKIRKTWIFKE